MKIVQLSSQNVLRINAVEITPEGNLIVIGGENAQGKTSVLDSILLAMGGKKAKHQEPLKQGTKKGKIVVKVGEGDDQLIVTRTFTAKGGQLTVVSKDGRKYSSPQTVLDKLTGELTFDPLEFAKSDNKKQLETLKNLVGLDFTELDEQRADLYSTRTDWNKAAKRLKVTVESMEDHDAPLVEIDIKELMNELAEAMESKALFDKLKVDSLVLKEEFLKHTETIAELERQIEGFKINRVNLLAKAKSIKEEIAEIKTVDIGDIRERIETAEETNNKIRNNITLNKSAKELEEAEEMSASLTEQITAVDELKADLLEQAEFPVKGLSFDDTGVLFNNVPFLQASSAEKLRTSIAMGIALNPDLRVLLIRDGSLLDETNLKMVAKMAEEADSQVWLERVGKGKECSVIIEDGMVK